MSGFAKKRGGGGSKQRSSGFQSLGLSSAVFKGVMRMGFKVPTPVQRKALPIALTGVDTVCMARTGSGKTAAFTIPMLEKLGERRSKGVAPRAVVLSPTRDLALQTLKVVRSMATFTDLLVVPIVGGDSMERQFEDLASGPDVVIATPGRLAHHLLEVPDFALKHVELIIYDEADRLFEMGFAQQIREICRSMPESRQTMMFSATMPKMLVEFARAGLQDPTMVRLDSEATVSETLRVSFLTCRSAEKDAALLYVLREILPPKGLTIVFAATRHHVELLTSLINSTGMEAVCIYGSMDTEARKSNLHRFRTGKVPLLVVTDVAARGLDVPLIDNVIHHSFPPSPKLFIHRSGRAARAGRVGYAFALVEPDEMPFMVDLHLVLGRKLLNPAQSAADRAKEEEKMGKSKDKEADHRSGDNGDNDSEEKHDEAVSEGSSDGLSAPVAPVKYCLTQQTPDDVHFGSIPESVMTDEMENVRRLIQSERGGGAADNMESLIKTAKNGMKKYKRSRPDPSREGVRRSKDILKGPIPPHPLLAFVEERKLNDMRAKNTDRASRPSDAGAVKTTMGTAEDYVKRNEFLTAMSTFRPKETIFEARPKGGGSTGEAEVTIPPPPSIFFCVRQPIVVRGWRPALECAIVGPLTNSSPFLCPSSNNKKLRGK